MNVDEQVATDFYDRHEHCFYIEQNRLAVSTTGMWSLASAGFCGCMGIIAGPAERGQSGGIVAHIAEGGALTGGDAGFERYTQEIVSCMLRWLRPRHWNCVDVALFKGQGAGSYPNLPQWIEATYGRLVNQVHDARARSVQLDSSGFMFDTQTQTLYISGYRGPYGNARSADTFERYAEYGQEIRFRHTKLNSNGTVKYRYYHLP